MSLRDAAEAFQASYVGSIPIARSMILEKSITRERCSTLRQSSAFGLRNSLRNLSRVMFLLGPWKTTVHRSSRYEAHWKAILVGVWDLKSQNRCRFATLQKPSKLPMWVRSHRSFRDLFSKDHLKTTGKRGRFFIVTRQIVREITFPDEFGS